MLCFIEDEVSEVPTGNRSQENEPAAFPTMGSKINPMNALGILKSVANWSIAPTTVGSQSQSLRAKNEGQASSR